MAKEKGVSFEIVTNDVNQECLVGDQLRVNQVFINVIANAVKFTPRGGKVTMKLSEKQTSPEHIHLRCIISDNGIGMKKDFLSRVFLPFEQETAEIAQHFGGTGLGLAITHNLVNLMGGSIDVQSEEGKGSTFTIDLPFGISKDSAKHSESLLELRALVIDDDKDTCEHACVLLDQLGQKTEYALSGKEGIEKIKQAMQDNDPFDICFLDWKMPEMDGEATAREIRKIVGPETLIIIISAYDWSPIEGRAKEIGINGFIAKPFFSSSFYNWLSDPSIKENKGRDKDIVVQENTKKKRVLLAEDNEFNAEVAQDFLDMAGYTAEVVGDGAQAVKAFETHEPGYYSMIFMDIQMPVMNGLEAAQMIRSLLREDAHTIPIVAMTANAFSEDVSKSLNAGMNDHISKPIDLKKSFAVPEDHELVVKLQESFKEVTGEDLPIDYDPSVCDSNILAVSCRIPVVTFGPSGGSMHGDNEYGYPYQVKNCYEIYKKTVKKLHVGAVARFQMDINFVCQAEFFCSLLHLTDAHRVIFSRNNIAVHKHVAAVWNNQSTGIAAC